MNYIYIPCYLNPLALKWLVFDGRTIRMALIQIVRCKHELKVNGCLRKNKTVITELSECQMTIEG